MENEFIRVRDSKIKGKGAFAKKKIPKGIKIVEYIGPKISNKEADRVAEIEEDEGDFYLFEINGRHTIFGNVPWNIARFLNHGCDPNCETDIEDGHIWITTIKDVKKGDELTYDYGIDADVADDHPCKCGAKNCCGYIVDADQVKKLKRRLARKRK